MTDLIDCTMCEGSGEVHETGYSLSPFSGSMVADPQCQRDYRCPRCQGEGVEPEVEPVPYEPDYER